MPVQFKFLFWTPSAIVPNSNLSIFDSKAKVELTMLRTKQTFEKELAGLSFEIALLFHSDVMNYEHNCKFLNKSTRWLHCSWMQLFVCEGERPAFCRRGSWSNPSTEFFLHLNLWVLLRNAKYDKDTERFSYEYKNISPGQIWEK